MPGSNEQRGKEKTIAKVLFGVLVFPSAGAVFFRLFFVLFRIVYGHIVVVIFGPGASRPVTVIAVITAIGFTAGVLAWLYRQYNRHILKTL
jgi:hypothetical protein